MLPICYICLKADIKLCMLNDDLDSYYEEICDYNLHPEIQCCEECIRKLKYCYDFKQRCLLAVKTLKNWRKKKSHKISVYLLHRELPEATSKLAFCNKRNSKLYVYQTADNDKADLINTKSNYNHPHIMTIAIPQSYTQIDQYLENTSVESLAENGKEIKEESIEFVAFDNKVDSKAVGFNVNERLQNEIEENQSYPNDEPNNDDGTNDDLVNDDELNDVLDNDDGTNDVLDNDYNVGFNDKSDHSNDNSDNFDRESDSDVSLNNLIERFEKKISEMDHSNILGVKEVKTSKFIDKEVLKQKIKRTFENYGAVKDRTGKDIDMDIVLYSLDISAMTKLLSVEKVCAGDGPFSKDAIDKLAELQNLCGKYNRSFTMEYLHDEGQMRIEFEKRRESSEYVKSKHRCDTCVRGFKSDEMLQHHIDTVHDKSNIFECKLCKSNHASRAKLLLHMKGHRLLYKCKTCPFVTVAKSTIESHCNRHTGHKYTCKDCGQNFNFVKALHDHLRSRHRTEHTCQLCAFKSVSELGLTLHIKRKHHVKHDVLVKSESNKKCDICDVTLLNDEVYQKHLMISHGDRSKKLRNGVNYRKQKKERPASYSCHLCDSVGHNPWWLSRHLRNLHPDDKAARPLEKKHLCAICGKGFANQFIYKDHLNTHTGIRPYSCDHCPKSFYSAATLRVHKLRHLPPMYPCRHCGNKFASAANLYNHVRGHIRDRRFKCEICGKGFIHKSAMREHVRGVHLNIKRVKKSRKNVME